MKRVRFRDATRQEFLHEVRWYETRRSGSGRRFRRGVNEALDLVRLYPGAGARAVHGARRMKVQGFPFCVIYRDEDNALVVFAVAPDKRQVGYWAERVDPTDRV